MVERIEHQLTRTAGQFRIVVLETPGDSTTTCAAVFGKPRNGCLVRVHSRCLYSEVFGSRDCDCREQLNRSLELIQTEGAGVVVYLEQEGRGSGLLAKAKGYEYSQRTGADTFASYEALDLPLDCRSYAVAGEVLQQLGLENVRLLTNNPDKVAGLKSAGLNVEREPLSVTVSGTAEEYVAAKRARGHLPPSSQPLKVAEGQANPLDGHNVALAEQAAHLVHEVVPPFEDVDDYSRPARCSSDPLRTPAHLVD